MFPFLLPLSFPQSFLKLPPSLFAAAFPATACGHKKQQGLARPECRAHRIRPPFRAARGLPSRAGGITPPDHRMAEMVEKNVPARGPSGSHLAAGESASYDPKNKGDFF